MNTITRIVHLKLAREPMDAWLSRWGCNLGGLTLCALTLTALRHSAVSRIEFLRGAVAALVACLLLILLGSLARQVHLAARDGRASWRSRRGELFSHGIGLVVLALGGWAFAGASPGTVETMVTGAFLILALYAAILCAGCWSTLKQLM